MRVDGMNVIDRDQMGMLKKTDSVSKGLQKQIANVQKRIQELSANKEMSMEEKMERRKELQEQMNDLNKQLRQHEFEQRKEKQQKSASKEDMSGSGKTGAAKNGKQTAGLSKASMTAMISADSAKEQAQSLGSVVTQLEGRKNVLGSEIEQDAKRGRDVTKKQGEFEDLEDRIVNAEKSQINMLTEAKEEMEEAAKFDQGTEETIAAKKKVSGEKNAKETKEEQGVQEINTAFLDLSANTEEPAQAEIYYTPIDIRL